MKKIRVLQFPIRNNKGGTTQYILQNWKFIDRTKFQFDFATMNKSLDFADVLEAEGCKIHYISCYAEDDRETFVSEFKKILKDGNYDIIHLHTSYWKSFIVEQIAKEIGIKKIIVHAHSTGVGILNEKKRQEAERLHERVVGELTEDVATDFWACSQWAADFLFMGKISHERIKIMPVSIDLTKFSFDSEMRDKYRKKYNLEGCFVIGHVGRFEYQKNHEFLVKVFNELSKKINSARLLLLGDGTLMPEVKSQAREMGIEEKIIFLGKFEDVCNWWYQVMDVFCLPSRYEGQPAVLVEAQASYLPCIYSDLVTGDATVNDNVFRIPLNIESWENKLVELYENQKETDRVQYGYRSVRALQNRGCDIRMEIKNIENEYMRGIL